jgi:branched-chain amino acid transport system permease protein
MADLGLIQADLVFGILLGCVFAVIAHGLNLIWGVTKVVNVAHGEFIMLGAYGAYYLNLYLGLNPLLSAPIDAAIGLGAGVVFYFAFLYRELRGKEEITHQSEMVTLVATFGLSLALTNLAIFFFKGNFVGIPYNPGTLSFGAIKVPLGGLYVAIASLGIIAFTQFLLTRTYLGNAVRAYSQDIAASKLMGVNPVTVGAFATALGFSVTMAGGALLTVWISTGINPEMGHIYAPISFVIVVLGGPGRMWGSLAGGLAVGIIIDVGQALVENSLIAYAAAFLVVIPVLLIRSRVGSLR